MSRSRVRALWATLQGAVAILTACREPALAGGDGGSSALNAVTAVVTSVKASRESAMYLNAEAEFRNSSSVRVTVRSYAIDWPQGRFMASDVAIEIIPCAVVSRTAQVGPHSGPM